MRETQPAALATVTSHGDPVWEIGMETHPDAQARGLGHAVVNAAANWILENDRIVLATVGTFNIPSARTLRSVGLRYAFMTIDGRPGPFMVQPQPSGQPATGRDALQLLSRLGYDEGDTSEAKVAEWNRFKLEMRAGLVICPRAGRRFRPGSKSLAELDRPEDFTCSITLFALGREGSRCPPSIRSGPIAPKRLSRISERRTGESSPRNRSTCGSRPSATSGIRP